MQKYQKTPVLALGGKYYFNNVLLNHYGWMMADDEKVGRILNILSFVEISIVHTSGEIE